jgi:hypothetical protein
MPEVIPAYKPFEAELDEAQKHLVPFVPDPRFDLSDEQALEWAVRQPAALLDAR